MNTSIANPIREYWQDRANQNEDSQAATTNDVYLRELEIDTIVATVRSLDRQPSSLLDVGCGDGYSTLTVAKALTGVAVRGIDYSSRMIEIARDRLARDSESTRRVRFEVSDALDLAATLESETFDVVLTDRCLINLPTLELQARAVGEIAAHVRPQGHYLAIENFADGQQNLNDARATVGLPPIPVRWHNRFFTSEEFLRATRDAFDIIETKDFSSAYYFATRVIYSAMCKMRGEEPDYNHDIHRLAVHLPWTGRFSPIRMVVLRKR